MEKQTNEIYSYFTKNQRKKSSFFCCCKDLLLNNAAFLTLYFAVNNETRLISK